MVTAVAESLNYSTSLQSNVAALIITIGFAVYYTILTLRNPKKVLVLS